MNPYKRPALRSAVIIAFFLAMSAWSYLTNGSSRSSSIPYVQQSGFVTDRVNARDEGYYVTIVRRPGEPPWLIVAKPLPLDHTEPHLTTEMSSAKRSVTIDGHEYDEEFGQCIIALSDGPKMTLQRLSPQDYPLLATLPDLLNELTIEKFESILPNPEIATNNAFDWRPRAAD